MSKELRPFTITHSPFEEFELIISWHTYQRLADDVDQYNSLFDLAWELAPSYHQKSHMIVLLDYLGANGFAKDHRFFSLKLDKELRTFEIARIQGSINPGNLFDYCDKLQFENKDQLSQSVVHSITRSIEEVFASNTKIFG